MRLGIDIGGTKVESILLDAAGETVARHRGPSAYGAAAVVDCLTQAATEVTAQAGVELAEVSVGIGIPGSVRDGVIHQAVNLGIESFPLGATLAQQWQTSVQLENDVDAAAFGAAHLSPEVSSLAYLNVGTGLAAGLVLNGKLWRGASNSAGEIGYISISQDGPVDAFGVAGGIESYASGSGISRQWGAEVGARQVIQAAADGDERAQEIIAGVFFGLASAVQVLVLTLDVEKVYLGGGLTRWGQELLTGMTAVCRSWEGRSPVLESINLSSRVEIFSSAEPVAALGAAMLGAERG